ncbi:MAG TPA: hypothetical protein VEI80_04765 [Candidatus Acidoferrales bacterium]|nr:hypothetical protein [Candidatus Acidoferrales bacterium]
MENATITPQPSPLPPIESKMSQILLLLCSGEAKTYSELKRLTEISDTGLSNNLLALQERGLLMKVNGVGYMTTSEGGQIARQLRLVSEATVHKLARRLVILQKLVEPKELLTFETLRALSRPPKTLRSYLALAVASAIDISYLNEIPLHVLDELRIYEAALKTAKELFLANPNQKKVSVIFRVDLNEGFDIVAAKLKEEIEAEKDERTKMKLTHTLRQMQEKREALQQEATERFVIK